MQTIIVVALLGCVAAASALTLVNPNSDLDKNLGTVGATKKSTYSTYEKHTKVSRTVNGKAVNEQNDFVEGGDEQTNNKISRLQVGNTLQYNFKHDFEDRINPVNRGAEWRWARTSRNDEYVANSGTFLRDSHSNSVDLISIPFKGWVPQDESRVTPIADNWQAVLVNKQNITVEPGQKLTVHVKFTCTTFNNEESPLAKKSSASISRPEDDPTLAACGIGLVSNDDSGLIFNIIATNKGIWAAYQRNPFVLLSNPELHQRKFSAFKRIGSRRNSYEVVDAAIKYDRSQGEVKYLINNEVVYTLGDLGTLNQIVRENPAYGDVYTANRRDLVRSQPQDFQVYIGLTQFLDTIDPNNPSNPPLHTVKLTSAPNYYDEKARFEDNESLQQDVNWGQGASMTLIEAEIKLKESNRVEGRVGRNQPEQEGGEEEEQTESENNNNNPEAKNE